MIPDGLLSSVDPLPAPLAALTKLCEANSVDYLSKMQRWDRL